MFDDHIMTTEKMLKNVQLSEQRTVVNVTEVLTILPYHINRVQILVELLRPFPNTQNYLASFRQSDFPSSTGSERQCSTPQVYSHF